MKLFLPIALSLSILLSAQPAISSTMKEAELMSIAETLYQQQRFKGSETVCRKLLQKYPQNAPANLLLINSDIAQGNQKNAVTDAKTALSKIPANGELTFLAAYAFDLSGDLQDSNRLYLRAFDLAPEREAHIMGKTRALCRSGQANEATKFILAQAEKKHSSVDLWESAMEASLDAENVESCRLALSRINKLLPDKKKTVSNETLTQAGWRLIKLDPWDSTSYPEVMRLFVHMDSYSEAINLSKYASRKFQTDARLYRSFKTIIEANSHKGTSSEAVWNSLAKLCSTQEKDAGRMFAAESRSKLSLKGNKNL